MFMHGNKQCNNTKQKRRTRNNYTLMISHLLQRERSLVCCLLRKSTSDMSGVLSILRYIGAELRSMRDASLRRSSSGKRSRESAITSAMPSEASSLSAAPPSLLALD